jgi:hypothetical protein
MRLCSSRRALRFPALLLFTLLSFPIFVHGCAPWFPQSWLYAREDFLIAAPVLTFETELKPLLPERPSDYGRPPSTESTSPFSSTAEVERQEIRQALEAKNSAPEAITTILAALEHFREHVEEVTVLTSTPERWRKNDHSTRIAEARRLLRSCPLPEGLEPAFRLYLEGARAFHASDHEAAQRAWQAIIALPLAQSAPRLVWAHYMLGRSLAASDPESAIFHFRACREAQLEGAPDPLWLAGSSLGEEARLQLQLGRAERGLELYFAQYHAGFPGALESLRLVIPSLLRKDAERLEGLVRHPVARRLLTAYLLSDPFETVSMNEVRTRQNWLGALRDAGVHLPTEASRFALLAYQGNFLEESTRWLNLAPPSDPLAEWIRAKLLMREGDLIGGRAKLDALFADLPPSFEQPYGMAWPASFRRSSAIEFESGTSSARIGTEAGLIALSRGDFVNAAEAFWKARQWHELAYLAERVLTTEELIAFLDRRDVETTKANREDDSFNTRLKALTARRLTREGRFAEARSLFPAEWREVLDAYNTAVRDGFDFELSNEERARALWRAAQLMRERGFGLVATELAPDFVIHGGYFEFEDDAQRRREFYVWNEPLHPTAKEFERLNKTGTIPAKRFHYRYLAAEWAALAAQLLPPDDGDAARLLITAGKWLSNRDPDAANPYYRQLVVQCGRHPLGQAAEAQKWFPDLDTEPFASR